MTGRSELVVSCVAAKETRASDHINKSVIITTTGQRPLQIQIVGNHTLATTKGSLEERKTIVSKKTRKIETRVQRQVVLEDGRIVADTGPQVITRTTEDVNTENTEAGRNRADIPEEENDDSLSQSDTSVVRSITETRTTRKSASKEVNHYHDEERREITSPEELVIGMNSPQELLERIDNEFPEEIKGKLMFYSSKSKGLVCKEKVNEISRLDCNGNLRTVTTHTRHEEETTEDELPEQHVPSALPDLGSSGHAEWPQFGDNVLVIPISQKPCYKTAAHPSSKSGSSSNGDPVKQGEKRSGAWTVERRTGDNGTTDLVCVTRRDTGTGIWDIRSSTRDSGLLSATKAVPQFPPLQRRALDRAIATNEYTLAQSVSGKRTAERRQRGLLLDGHESCPAPPVTQTTATTGEESHYELLWDARTGERRSPSPAKSETFTKARGRRIAQMLAQRRYAGKRTK